MASERTKTLLRVGLGLGAGIGVAGWLIKTKSPTTNRVVTRVTASVKPQPVAGRGKDPALSREEALALEQLDRLVRSDPARALGYARTLGVEVPERLEIERALKRWIRAERGAALRRIEELPEGHPKDELLGCVLAELATCDAEAALAAVRELPAGERRDRLVLEIIRALAPEDPRMAAAYSSAVVTSPQQARARRETVAGFVGRGAIEEALAWAQAQTDPQERHAILREIAAWFVHGDPEVAIAIAGVLPPGGARDDVIRRAQREMRARPE